jgi:hypothetical protein
MTQPEGTTAWTSASALHEILRSLVSQEVSGLAAAWSNVLGVQFGELDFALRHGEVINLWKATMVEIDSLRSERSRDRALGYANSWWTAAISPSVNWETNTRPLDALSLASLDQLEATAEIISSQTHGAASIILRPNLAEIVTQCTEWLELLEGTEEIDNEEIRRTLQSQLRHLVWLIENVDKFGVSRIVETGDQVTGALARTATLSKGNVKDPERFTARLKKLIVAVAMVAELIQGTTTIIDAARDSMPAIERVITPPQGPNVVNPPDNGQVIS